MKTETKNNREYRKPENFGELVAGWKALGGPELKPEHVKGAAAAAGVEVEAVVGLLVAIFSHVDADKRLDWAARVKQWNDTPKADRKTKGKPGLYGFAYADLAALCASAGITANPVCPYAAELSAIRAGETEYVGKNGNKRPCRITEVTQLDTILEYLRNTAHVLSTGMSDTFRPGVERGGSKRNEDLAAAGLESMSFGL